MAVTVREVCYVDRSRLNDYDIRCFPPKGEASNRYKHPESIYIYTISLPDAADLFDPGHEWTPSHVSRMHLALQYHLIDLAATSWHQMSIGKGSAENQGRVWNCLMFHGLEMEC